MTQVAGLVLAAGAGRRFGGPKAVVELGGERLVDRAVRVVRDGGADPTVVVTGAVALEVEGATVVANAGWTEGIGSSLRAGLSAMPTSVDAVAVVLADQPGLTADALRRLLVRVTDRRALVAATYDGTLGHPVVVGRDHWAGVAAVATGDRGARPYLDMHPDLLDRVECGDVATDADVDEPGDLVRFGLPDQAVPDR